MIAAKILRCNNSQLRQEKLIFNSAALTLVALIFMIAAAAKPATAQTYTDLFNFNGNGGPNDPFFSVIAQGRDGNLYTTSEQGFTGQPGDVFKITPEGKLTMLHEFHGADGQDPVGGLTLATDGKFYGSTATGGAFGFGTIFSITDEGALKTLYSFSDKGDGSLPYGVPIEGNDGNFYGTASSCVDLGSNNTCETPSGNKFGAVYRITPEGKFHTLHTFDGKGGANPLAPLVLATDGNFYGTTFSGGANGLGTVFRISPSGNFKVLFSFDAKFGGGPFAPLIEGSDGNLYGVTSGASGGTVFKVTCEEVAIIHNFAGGNDGTNPVGGLVQATDGNLYGTNNIGPVDFVGGVIFRLTPKGPFATLHEFDGTSGGSPQTTLLQHTKGLLYGETCCGGNGDDGVFYSLNADLRPFVSLLPVSGEKGSTVGILGQGFNGATHVFFDDKPARFKVESDTFLTAIVPEDASTGFVIVRTPKGRLTSNKKFQVNPRGDGDRDGDDSGGTPPCAEEH